MSILYHVSRDLFHDGKFIPRIPMDRTEGEDEKIGRVSVAPTIEDCLSAIPGGGSRLDETIIDRRGYFKVFKIDTKKLEIADSDVVKSEYLFKNNLLPDAYHTDEHWITVPFVVAEEDSFFIKLGDYKEEIQDLIPHEIYEIADEKYDGDYLEAYCDIKGITPPHMTCITDICYYTNFLKKGQKIEIMLDYWDDESQEIKAVIHDRFKDELKLIDEDDSHLTCEATKGCDIRGLFMHHYKFVS